MRTAPPACSGQVPAAVPHCLASPWPAMLAGHALAGRASHPSRLEGGGLAARGSGGHAGAAHCSPLHATWYYPTAASTTSMAFLSPTVGLLLHACTSVVVLLLLSSLTCMHHLLYLSPCNSTGHCCMHQVGSCLVTTEQTCSACTTSDGDVFSSHGRLMLICIASVVVLLHSVRLS